MTQSEKQTLFDKVGVVKERHNPRWNAECETYLKQNPQEREFIKGVEWGLKLAQDIISQGVK